MRGAEAQHGEEGQPPAGVLVGSTVEDHLAQERLDPHAVALDRDQRVLVGQRPVLEHDVGIVVPADAVAAGCQAHFGAMMRSRQHLE